MALTTTAFHLPDHFLHPTAAFADAKHSVFINPTSIHPHRIKPGSPTISAVNSSTTTTPPSKSWNIDSWKSKKAFQLPEYPDKTALESVVKTLESFPPIVFAGEARSLEERLGQAALGNAFLLQGGDCAESFKEFSANNIRDTFRVLLQMSVVLMFGSQMPVFKVFDLSYNFILENICFLLPDYFLL